MVRQSQKDWAEAPPPRSLSSHPWPLFSRNSSQCPRQEALTLADPPEFLSLLAGCLFCNQGPRIAQYAAQPTSPSFLAFPGLALWGRERWIIFQLLIFTGFPGGASGKEPVCQCRRCGFDPWVGSIPWSRKWQSTLVFLPGESHGQRSLAGYSPWGHKELDTTEDGRMRSTAGIIGLKEWPGGSSGASRFFFPEDRHHREPCWVEGSPHWP